MLAFSHLVVPECSRCIRYWEVWPNLDIPGAAAFAWTMELRRQCKHPNSKMYPLGTCQVVYWALTNLDVPGDMGLMTEVIEVAGQ